jgi:hypothetical protein
MESDRGYEIAEPRAAAMIESLRAVGYDLRTAIADLIDNSIFAGAKNVWVYFHWNGADSHISIVDDGCGMSESELFEAMRPGSKSPVEDREPGDLGRFGLGMKTASFSQCRRLTVASRKDGENTAIRRWDLDHVTKVDRWELLKYAAQGSDQRITHFDGIKHGTIVLWECLDRVVGDAHVRDKTTHDRFFNLINSVEDYLAMVFHRFLGGTNPKLEIFINGSDDSCRVKPWDPFLESHEATIQFPEEPIHYGGKVIKVKGFVLPHKDKLGEELHNYASGPAGWNAQQGFYVYRNQRLLVPGSWLGLGTNRPWTKEEHYKLARIRIDIPNTADMDWQIDVKKSTARPPLAIRSRLKDIADAVRKQAREVFAHRGSYGPRPRKETMMRAWYPVSKQGRLSYKIDRSHPLVKQLLSIDSRYKSMVEALLRVLEETVPVQQIWLDTAEKPEAHSRPFEGVSKAEITQVLRMTYTALRQTEGLSPEAAKKRLSTMEAFVDYPELISALDGVDHGV